MSKSLAIAVWSLWAIACQAVAAAPHVPDPGPGGERYYISRILDADQIVLFKGAAPTAFIFSGVPGDSVKVACEGCLAWLGGEEGKGAVSMHLKSATTDMPILQSNLGRWLPLPSQGGKVALLISRDTYGDRQISLQGISIYRKSVGAAALVAGTPVNMLEINNLALPKSMGQGKATQTVFHLAMREEDSYKVKVMGDRGHVNPAVTGFVFKAGEEFAKQPLTLGAVTALPANGEGMSQFGFGFSELPDSKGYTYYHIDIDRIPLRNSGEPSTHDR